MNQPKIACRNVWKLYGPDPEKFLASHDGIPSIEAVREAGYIPAVRDASLEVHEGEIVVLMGLSGSGKSTVVALVQRFYDIQSGRVLVDGRDVREIPPAALRSAMGYVQQEPQLFGISIRDNVTYGTQHRERHDVAGVWPNALASF